MVTPWSRLWPPLAAFVHLIAPKYTGDHAASSSTTPDDSPSGRSEWGSVHGLAGWWRRSGAARRRRNNPQAIPRADGEGAPRDDRGHHGGVAVSQHGHARGLHDVGRDDQLRPPGLGDRPYRLPVRYDRPNDTKALACVARDLSRSRRPRGRRGRIRRLRARRVSGQSLRAWHAALAAPGP